MSRVPSHLDAILSAYLEMAPIIPTNVDRRREWFLGLIRAAYAVGYSDAKQEAHPTGVHHFDPETQAAARKWSEAQRQRARRLREHFPAMHRREDDEPG